MAEPMVGDLYTGPDEETYVITDIRVTVERWPKTEAVGHIDMPLSVFKAGWDQKGWGR